MELRGDRPGAGRVRAAGEGDGGRGIRRRQRDDSAQGGRAAPRGYASPSGAAQIGAANTLSFEAGEIQADNTDAQGLLDALPDFAGWQAGPGAGRRRRRPRRRLGAAARRRRGRRLESHAAACQSSLCEKLGGEPVEASLDLGDYELLVNSTSVGLQGARIHLSSFPLARRVCSKSATPSSTSSMARGRRVSSAAAAGSRAPPPSTASRSSSAKARSRSRSGPAASLPLAMSCATPLERRPIPVGLKRLVLFLGYPISDGHSLSSEKVKWKPYRDRPWARRHI